MRGSSRIADVLPLFLQERLSLRNAELSESLAATQHSRSVLEREALGLKRTLLETRTVTAQVEEALAQVGIHLVGDSRKVCHPHPLPLQSARQKEAVEVQLRAVQEDARVRVAELQQQLDTTVAAKAEKVSR